MKIILWIKASLEESPGRASGKAIIAAMLSILFGYRYLYVLLGHPIFTEQQENLIENGDSIVEVLIISLYGVKVIGKGVNAFNKWVGGSDDQPPKDPKTSQEKDANP